MATVKLPFAFPQTQVTEMRAAICAQLCAGDGDFSASPIRALHPDTLRKMMQMYDELFLRGFLSRKLNMLEVTCSARMTSSAGKFICTKGPFGSIRHAEIRMSSDYFLRLSQGPFCLNGLTADTAQEAFLIVFEHELCHVLETLLYHNTGHSDRFLSLAHGLFGHTGTRHSLPTRRQEAAKEGIVVGMRTSFVYQGKNHCGVITHIGKAVTVMVPSPGGGYRDGKGTRYSKYRVPYEKLTLMP